MNPPPAVASSPESHPVVRQRLWRRLGRWLAGLVGWLAGWPLLVLVVAVVVLRLVWRDRIDSLAFVYYASPPLLLAVLAGFSLWVCRRTRRRIAAGAGAVLLIGCGLWGLGQAWAWPWRRVAPADLRVCQWNVARGVAGWRGVAAQLRALDADLIGVVEAGRTTPKRIAFWKEAFPDYQQTPLFDEMLLMSRCGKLETIKVGRVKYRLRYQIARLTLDDKSFIVFLLDLPSTVTYPRTRTFAAINDLLAPYADEPHLILGDFNTPSDSVYFDRWRATRVNAAKVAGRGYEPTWPNPVPLLMIDQIWAHGLLFTDYRAHFTLRSDHCPIVAGVRLGDGGQP